jgi:hypothetical protein
VQAIRRTAVLLLAALPLLWVALANGFPLLFADSGGYLRIGTELYFPLDRPVSYGLLILPLHRLGGLWAVALAQAFFAAWLIGHVLTPILDRPRPWYLPATTALLAATSLPWFAGQVMPDLFAALLPLALHVLVTGAKAMRWPERLGWTALCAGLTALHLSHLPLAAAVLAALLLATRRTSPGPALAAASIALALLGLSSLNFVGAGRFRPSVMEGSFLFTRLLDARLAQPALARACEGHRLLLCELRPLADDPRRALPGQDYLWSADSPREDLRRRDPARLAAEEKAIVRTVVAEQPVAVARLVLTSWRDQLVTARSGDGLIPYGPAMQAHRQVTTHFAGQADAWANSRQQRGELQPLAILPDLAIAGLGLFILLIAAARDPRLVPLAATVVSAVLANAAICGVLSGVFDRYEARVLWLLPFAAVVALWRLLDRTEPRRRPLVARG